MLSCLYLPDFVNYLDSKTGKCVDFILNVIEKMKNENEKKVEANERVRPIRQEIRVNFF